MKKQELIKLLEEKSKKIYNPNCDVYEDSLYFGFRLDLKGKEKNLFIFDNGSYKFDFLTNLLSEPNQISNVGLKRFLDKEKIKPRTMYEQSKDLSREYLELEDILYDLLTLWNIHTFGINLFGVTPYIHIKGSKDSGKSTIMKFCSKLTPKSEYVINPSNSSLFRGIDISQNTVFIDEFENYDDRTKNEIRTILNSGYTQGISVPRTDKNSKGEFKKVRFKTFCPKMFGSINEIETTTLKSRTIELYTLRNNRKVKDLDKMRIEDKERFTKLRDDYYLFWLQNWKKIEEIYDNLPDIELYGRSLQIIKPILTLSKFFGNYDRILGFFKLQMKEKQDNLIETDRDFLLLKVLYNTLDGKDTERISVKDMVNELNKELGYNDYEYKDKTYKSTNKSVGRQLSRFLFTKYRKRLSNGMYYDLNIKIIRDRIKRHGYEQYFEDLDETETQRYKTLQDESSEKTKEKQIWNEINDKTSDYMDDKYGVETMVEFNERNGFGYDSETRKYKSIW